MVNMMITHWDRDGPAWRGGQSPARPPSRWGSTWSWRCSWPPRPAGRWRSPSQPDCSHGIIVECWLSLLYLEDARLDSSVTLLSEASRQRPRIPWQFWARGLRTTVLLMFPPGWRGQPSWVSSLATLQEYWALTILSSACWLMWHCNTQLQLSHPGHHLSLNIYIQRRAWLAGYLHFIYCKIKDLLECSLHTFCCCC